jgi:hypothetical protein
LLAELARARVEGGEATAGYLVEDAARELEAVQRHYPADAALLLERARCAFYLSDFGAQERLAAEALAAAGRGEDARVEALRWLGDAAARLIPVRAGGPEDEELAGLQRAACALGEVALGPEADATDWLSWASFFGATRRPGEQCAVLRRALLLHSDSDPLRALFSSTAQASGAPEALAEAYLELAASRPGSGAAAWYAGWALVNLAEWQRRGERPAEALESYARAEAPFERARELVPAFAESSAHYLGMIALGRGFAFSSLDDRARAAEELERAIRIRPELAGVRDGLDREPLDLVDAVLEWRASGASPVDGEELARRLTAADGSGTRWALAVADGLLREGLRALSRNRDLEAGLAGLRASVRVARAARAVADGDAERRALAQSAASLAEVLLEERLETAEASGCLREAAEALGVDAPAPGAGFEELGRVAVELRARLGPARPVARPGR